MDKIIKNDDIDKFTLTVFGDFNKEYVDLEVDNLKDTSNDKLNTVLPGEGAEDNDTLLIRASRRGAVKIVAFLLKNGADVNAAKQNGVTALYIAAQEGRNEILEMLLKSGASPNKATLSQLDGAAPMHIAAQFFHNRAVELLLAYGANPNLTADNGQTPLHVATITENKELVEILVLGKHTPPTDLNIPNNCGHTPIYLSIIKKNIKICDFLIKHGAIIDHIGVAHLTPLGYAIHNDEYQIATLLLENKADPNLQPKVGISAFCFAIYEDKLRFVDLLLHHGADVNSLFNLPNVLQKNKTMSTLSPLMVSVLNRGNNSCRVILLLLQHGAKVDMPNNKGKTALFYAVKKNHLRAADLLLEKGANPNAKSLDGFTPICCAIVTKNKSLVELLIKKGADLTISTKLGSVLDIATLSNDTAIINLIKNPKQAFEEKPSLFASLFGWKKN